VAKWDTLTPYDHLTLHAAQAVGAEGSGFIILQREVSVSYRACPPPDRSLLDRR
jgi:hypothetical protein